MRQAAFECAATGNLEGLKQLLNAGFPIDTQNRIGDTLLHVATRTKDGPMIEELKKRGASETIANKWGQGLEHIERLEKISQRKEQVRLSRQFNTNPLESPSSETRTRSATNPPPPPSQSLLSTSPSPSESKQQGPTSNLQRRPPLKTLSEKSINRPQQVRPRANTERALPLTPDDIENRIHTVVEKQLSLWNEDIARRLDEHQMMNQKEFESFQKHSEERHSKLSNEQFEAFRIEQEKTISKLLDQHQKSLSSLLGKEQEKLQTTLGEAIKMQGAVSEITPELVLRVKEQLGSKFEEKIKSLTESTEYQQQVASLQKTLITEIEERQGRVVRELSQTKSELIEHKEKHSPLYKEYQAREALLLEQQALLSPLSVRAFYTLIEQRLGARLMSAYLLASGMISRDQGWGDIAAELGTTVVTGLLEGLPFGGGLAANLVGFGLEKATGAGIDYYNSRQFKKVQQGMVRQQDVMSIAELVARRITQNYLIHLRTLTEKAAISGAKNAVDLVYDCLKSMDKEPLSQFASKSQDERAKILVQEVAKAAKKKGGLFKVGVTPSPHGSNLSAPSSRQVNNLTQDVQQMKFEHHLWSGAQQRQQISTLVTNEDLGRACTLFKEDKQAKEVVRKQFHYQLQRQGNALTLSLVSSCPDANQELKLLNRCLADLFSAKLLLTTRIERPSLILIARTDPDAEDLETFFQKCGLTLV